MNDDITRERAIEVLKSLQKTNVDPDSDHQTADDILCRLLKTLGYADVVEEWNKIYKWYS